METLARSLDFLGRTPHVLAALLEGLEDEWVRADEGPDTYSPRDVLAHLIHGEDTDWIPRIEHILAHGAALPFARFEREGLRPGDSTLSALLARFAARRGASLARLGQLGLGPADLARPGRHPELGPVTLGQLLNTWVAHDLTHLAQIARVLARARADEMGPWTAYFRLLAARLPPGPAGGSAPIRRQD